MLGQTKFLSKKFFCPKKSWAEKTLGLKLLVKIGSAIAEILLIWTNVARTNVAWTNVTITVEICSIRSQELTFSVWSKSGHKQVRYCRH